MSLSAPVRDEAARVVEGLKEVRERIGGLLSVPGYNRVQEAIDFIERTPASQVEAGEVEALREAVRVSAQAFRTLEEVAVAQLEHDKARNFIQLGDRCRAALAPKEQP